MFRTMLFCLSNPVDRQTDRIHARFVSHRDARIGEACQWVLLMMPLDTSTEQDQYALSSFVKTYGTLSCPEPQFAYCTKTVGL